jgi:hypothetical protein
MRWANGQGPAVEALETRLCLDCTFDQVGAVLIIKGDRFDNDIAITDDGTDGDGNIEADCDGDGETFDGVQTVRINTGKSGDVVTYEFTDDLISDRNLQVNLDRGNDTFTLMINPVDAESDRTISARLNVVVRGGAGRDEISAEAVDVILDEANVVIRLRGNDRSDTVSFEGNLAGDSSGRIIVGVVGGRGRDNLTLLIDTAGNDLDGPALFKIKGGRGFDTCTFTEDLVVVKGCEDLNPV